MKITKPIPTVSIILPSYNGWRRGYILEAVESCLVQTYPDFELLVIDDGSSDNTFLQCQKKIQDKRVKCFHQTNQGPSAARNMGIRESRGKYIAFIDDDDRWYPDKLKQQIDFLENNPDLNCGMLGTDLDIIDPTGRIIATLARPVSGDMYQHFLYNGNLCAPSSVVIRKSVLDEIGPFRYDLHGTEDYELWLRIARRYPVFAINKPLTQYRLHPASMSRALVRFCWEKYRTLKIVVQEDPAIIAAEVLGHSCDRSARRLFGSANWEEGRRMYQEILLYRQPSLKTRIAFHISFYPRLANLLLTARRQLLQRYHRKSAMPDFATMAGIG